VKSPIFLGENPKKTLAKSTVSVGEKADISICFLSEDHPSDIQM
jgi:hypothetical protein